MKTLDMVKLFYEYLEAAHPSFESIQRPLTDTVTRLLTDSYIKTVDDLCRAETFPLSAQKVGANMEALRRLVVEQDVTPGATIDGTRYTVPASDFTLLYDYFVRAMAKITRTAVPVISPADWVETQPLHNAEVDAYVTTIYNKPIIRKPGITYNEGDGVEEWSMDIYVDVYSTLETLKVFYIGQPAPLTMDTDSECLLEPDSLCHDVTRAAVDQYIKARSLFTPTKEEQS